MDNSNTQKVKVTSIPTDVQITFTIGGGFYQRLNKLLINYSDSVDMKEYLAALYKIKKNIAHKDQYAFNLETLIILLRDIELSFKEAGLTEENEIDYVMPPEAKQLKEEYQKMFSTFEEEKEEDLDESED